MEILTWQKAIHTMNQKVLPWTGAEKDLLDFEIEKDTPEDELKFIYPWLVEGV